MKIRTKDGKIKEIIYDEKKLFQYGLNKLSSREYGRCELKTKMLNLQPSEEIVDKVLDKLQTMNYLSDERRIQSLINQFSSRESTNKIKQRIKQKGFTKEQIEDYLEENDELFDKENETEKAVSLLQKKFKQFDKENYQKMVSFLGNKGFPYDTISHGINAFKNNEFEI